MRFFTKFNLMLLAVLFGASMEANAAVEEFTDLYGKYKFTANIELTADGEEYKDRLLTECEVQLTKNTSSYYYGRLVNFAGAPNDIAISNYDLEAKTFTVNNPNTSSWYLWDSPLCISDAEGGYPFYIPSQEEGTPDHEQFELIFTYDDEGNITTPDFAVVTVVDWNTAETKLIAKYTNCKLTLIEQEIIVVPDMSGEYTFTTTSLANDASTFMYDSFELTLTATSEDFKKYTADIKFDENVGTTITDVTFDGSEMIFNFKENYLDAEKTYAFIGANGVLESSFSFSMASEKTLTLQTRIRIGIYYEEDGTTGYGLTQYYWTGAATKKTNEQKLDGVYRVKATPEAIIPASEIAEGFEWPTEFDVEIKYFDTVDGYYVVKFFGNDVYSINQGAMSSEKDGNTLKLTTGAKCYIQTLYFSDDYMTRKYLTFYDEAVSETPTPVEFTVNEDGTATMGNFAVCVTDVVYDESWAATRTSELACLYTVDSVTNGIEVVENTANTNAPEGIYTISGVRVADKAAKLSTLPTGMYIVNDGSRTVKVAR